MKRLELDFIASPRRRAWPGVVLLAVSLGIAAVLGLHYRDVQLELKRLEIAGSLVSSERRPARALPKERLDEAVKNAEAVVRQLTLPWGSLAESVESAATKDVALLQLQPDAQQRLLRLTAEARDPDAMLEYLRRLAAAPVLSDVHVVSHQVQRDTPQHPIQFAVQASFRGTP